MTPTRFSWSAEISCASPYWPRDAVCVPERFVFSIAASDQVTSILEEPGRAGWLSFFGGPNDFSGLPGHRAG